MNITIPNGALNGEWIKNDSYSSEYILVFLHEALGSIPQWKKFPVSLCEQLNLNGFVYERRGHGNSTALEGKRTNSYLHDYALKELPIVLDSILGEGKRAILIGHSDGGTISLLANHNTKNKIAGIVTMAAHVINEPETISGIQPAVLAYQSGKLDGLRKYHGDKTEDLFYAWADIWRSKEFKDWNICDEIESENPALFIQGREDQYGTIKQLNLIHSNYKGEHRLHLFENCGHHPHLENTDDCLSLIKAWFQEMFD